MCDGTDKELRKCSDRPCPGMCGGFKCGKLKCYTNIIGNDTLALIHRPRKEMGPQGEREKFSNPGGIRPPEQVIVAL